LPAAESTAPAPSLLFDTTLRDGEQAPGVALTPDEKARYVQTAEAAGVRYIEVGFPQNKSDLAACRVAAEAAHSSRLVAIALTTPESVSLVADIGAHEILFVVPSSESHLRYVYGGSFESLINNLGESIHCAARKELSVNVGLEDAGQRDMDMIHGILQRLQEFEDPIDCITVPDTRGSLLPNEVEALLQDIRERLPSPECRLAFHAHDDLGLATANTLAALTMDPPVDCVHVTTCGYGERAGNASLEQIAVLLETKLHRDSGIVLEKLLPLAKLVEELFLTPIHSHAPVIGSKVFLHESGLHQRGMLHDQGSYQFLDPAKFGCRAQLMLGKHSGRGLRKQLAARHSVREEDVYELQVAVSSTDKEPAKQTLRQALEMLDLECRLGLFEEEAARKLTRSDDFD
jgi:isopropylmalate/homocitrate/citramalate synthase